MVRQLNSLNSDGSIDPSVIPGYGRSMAYESPWQKLGLALSGVAAPFLGDNQWLSRLQTSRNEALQADMEFRAKVMQQQRQALEDSNQKELRDAQIRLYNAQSDYMSKMPNDNFLNPLLVNDVKESQPTLSDAIKINTEPFIQKQGVYGGKPSVQQVINPEYNKALELRNAAVKDVENFSGPLEKISTSIGQLRDAIKSTPEFKPGVLSKPLAQAQTFAADLGNTDWYKNYELSYNQNFLPLAQALNASKVLSDMDLKNIQKSLGDPSSPRNVKIKALDQLEKSISSSAVSKLKAFGVDPETYGKIYPGAYSTFINKQSSNLKQDPRYEAALKAGYKPEEIDAYLKGRK